MLVWCLQNLSPVHYVQLYKPVAETKCSFIDTLEDLVALNEKVCKLSEFAVDLEVWDEIKGLVISFNACFILEYNITLSVNRDFIYCWGVAC